MHFLGLLAFFCLLSVSACGDGNSVQIHDNAHVLNSSKVRSAASQLSNPLAIYTTGTFQGTQTDFQHTTRQQLKGDPNLIVMAIDTNHRYLYIARGSDVPLSGAGISQAVNAFVKNFNSGDYTGASLAAINSMHDSLNADRASGKGIFSNPFTLCCCLVPILLVLLLLLFIASKRGRIGGGGGLFGRGRWPFRRGGVPPDQGSYYGSPNQGPSYGPSNQGPPYGPPSQGGGVNPWVAGGLGAAAGGLAGYELGRLQDERERERSEDVAEGGGDFGDGGFDSGGGSFGGGGFGGDENSGGGGNF